MNLHAADSGYARGVVMILLAGVCLSTSGLILRHMEAPDGWRILFWRNFAFLLTLATFVFFRYRSRSLAAVMATGRAGVIVAVSLGLGAACYVIAMLHTTVANVVFIVSATPFITAVAAWLVLGERVSRGALAAMFAALIGIGLMFMDGMVHGRMLGNIIAIGVMVSFMIMLVAIRSTRGVDMVPAVAGAGVVGALLGLVMAGGDVAMSRHDTLLALLMGSAQFGVGFILITLGTRHVPAAEAALLSLTETVLAPLWVWLAVSETPSGYTLAGGLVVLAALLAQALDGIRREQARRRHRRDAPPESGSL